MTLLFTNHLTSLLWMLAGIASAESRPRRPYAVGKAMRG